MIEGCFGLTSLLLRCLARSPCKSELDPDMVPGQDIRALTLQGCVALFEYGAEHISSWVELGKLGKLEKYYANDLITQLRESGDQAGLMSPELVNALVTYLEKWEQERGREYYWSENRAWIMELKRRRDEVKQVSPDC